MALGTFQRLPADWLAVSAGIVGCLQSAQCCERELADPAKGCRGGGCVLIARRCMCGHSEPA